MCVSRLVLFKVLTIQRVEKNALGRKERKKKEKREDVCREKKMRKEKKRRYAYALCVGDILFEDDEFVCVCCAYENAEI